MTTYTTLNKIREYEPCAEGWHKLLSYLGKSEADDEPLSYATILKSNGLDDAIWALRTHPDLKQVVLFAADCAESVLHIFENEYADDDRPRKAIEAARKCGADANAVVDAANAVVSAVEGAAAVDARAAAARALAAPGYRVSRAARKAATRAARAARKAAERKTPGASRAARKADERKAAARKTADRVDRISAAADKAYARAAAAHAARKAATAAYSAVATLYAANAAHVLITADYAAAASACKAAHEPSVEREKQKQLFLKHFGEG